MRKNFTLFVLMLILTIFCGTKGASADTSSISFFPAQVIQGEPLLVQVNGVEKISEIKNITFGINKLGIFLYENKPSALYGIDLNKKVGDYKIVVMLADGTSLESVVTVGKREKVEKPLGIPEKLGGDTKASQDKLVASLVAEKKSLANISTNAKSLWTLKFLPPLATMFVTDAYGFSRKTGEYSISHKGTDYRAPTGTEVFVINRGIVSVTKYLRDYGNTVVIDHGQGLMSYYLHLSKIKVKIGQVVEQGQTIGLAGDTGYAIGAHLHLGIKINNTAIDPEKFLDLFK